MDSCGSMIVSGSIDNTVKLWDTRTANQTVTLEGHSENIKALIVSTDGSRIVSGSSDGAIKIWDIRQQRCTQTIKVHSEGRGNYLHIQRLKQI